MRLHSLTLLVTALIAAGFAIIPVSGSASGWTLVGWNNLGMHCLDADFQTFSILPPYNTIHAQLSDPTGALITNPGGITVTYEATVDPAGSTNTTSQGKTNFWDHVLALFGAAVPVDHGLAGSDMPGPSNTPQPMTWDAANGWWVAEGIPLTPYDDAMQRNAYPMFLLTARDASGAVLAVTEIVLPVSDEMDCRACHASGADPNAMPSGGWVNDPDPQIDYRENILLKHDDEQGGTQLYHDSLAAFGYDAGGLYATASGGTPVLCATCHASNALATAGYTGVSQLTTAVHGMHASVTDPNAGLTLEDSSNRSSCYRCHPGSTTKCLRGVMGSSVASDGTLAIQCQSCHGTMSRVGAAGRQGWLDEPTCQSCHTGTATANNGQIRYESAFTASGQVRVPVDLTFATNPDTPAAGISLYRFSSGHGGLKCEACHGSTHAEYPATHVNDNVQSVELQGHAGPLAECTACHPTQPQTVMGGPHGMHPIGQAWVSRHPDVAENSGTFSCKVCHGSNYRGTVLSYAQDDRTLSTKFGQKSWWRGFQVGCYACHRGPNSDTKNSNRPPVVQSTSVTGSTAAPVTIPLTANDADGNPLTLRIVSQPSHGTAGLAGRTATYYPEPGYQGADSFTFAAWDGSVNSNLGTATVTIGPSTCTLTCGATAPAAANEGTSVAFTGVSSQIGCAGTPQYSWVFGDGASAATAAATHRYPASGSYGWEFTVTVDGQTCSKPGSITVNGLPPTVNNVRKLKKPLRIEITGSNFHANMLVSVNGSDWTDLRRVGTTKIVLKGVSAIKAAFPRNTAVPITLTNPDDGLFVALTYNRSTNTWTAAP